MTINELLTVLAEILKTVFYGIGECIKCMGDIIVAEMPRNKTVFPSNSIKLFSNIPINRTVFFILLAYIAFINIFTYIQYVSDKKKAKRRDERISEKRLLGICFAGGAIGGMMGMNFAHHKTKKKKFTVTVTILFVIQTVLYCFLVGFLGFWAFF